MPPRILGLLGACLAMCVPMRALAGEMDPTLGRLALSAPNGGCAPSNGGSRCPDNQAFEELVSELAVSLAPNVGGGAASDGPRGFYLGLSSTLTSLRSGARYWAKGTRGRDPADDSNGRVDSVLAWNRIEVRKGLPFGIELGSSLGYGVDTSLWVISGELRVVLFEGFRSGLGALPDVALRAVTQSMVGSDELSLQTYAMDVTLSKPFVLAGQHRLTPLAALQVLFVKAQSDQIDLTPDQSALAACPSLGPGSTCSALSDNTRFRSLSQSRVRLFVGAEERYSLLSVALTFGIDLSVPQLQSDTPDVGLPNKLLRQYSVHLACGMHY